MRQTDARCQKANCGGTVEAIVGTFGRVAYVCARCERKKARLCRDCPARTPSTHHWRCATCAKKQRRDLGRVRDRSRYGKRRHQVLENHRKRRNVPEVRERRRLYMAEYRRRNGSDHFARLYNREYMRRRRADPVLRARELRRKREMRRHPGCPVEEHTPV